jgi:hypothetical protein
MNYESAKIEFTLNKKIISATGKIRYGKNNSLKSPSISMGYKVNKSFI